MGTDRLPRNVSNVAQNPRKAKTSFTPQRKTEIARVNIQSRRMRLAGQVAGMGKWRGAHRLSQGKDD
jgi:methionyl-tRNA formyltransferase